VAANVVLPRWGGATTSRRGKRGGEKKGRVKGKKEVTKVTVETPPK